ncbi:MAG TPA: hypothetical protein VK509_02955, partial [Polyangiales bacterium]|nr:hypothetical protein [Polyangiales bacterium]
SDARDAGAYAAMKQRVQTITFTGSKGSGMLIDQTRRFTRDPRRHGDPTPSPSLRAGYARSIAYDFALLRDALSKLHGDDLVLVMGDHQPPLIAGAHDDFASPMHAFARDPALLAELIEHGFAPRLVLAPHAESALRHEGLFSLLVRTLVRYGGQRSGLPPYLPHGVRLAE